MRWLDKFASRHDSGEDPHVWWAHSSNWEGMTKSPYPLTELRSCWTWTNWNFGPFYSQEYYTTWSYARKVSVEMAWWEAGVNIGPFTISLFHEREHPSSGDA